MTSAAELVRDFVNTYDVEDDTDDLASPAELSVWLRERALTAPGDRATDDDLTLAVCLREGLRRALMAGLLQGDAQEALEEALRALPLRVRLTPAGPGLAPLAAGVRGGLAAIAAAVARAQADGTWRRLKVCAEGTCRWAFIDASKNRSRAWCSMRVCGNRTKTRAYRARQHRTRPS
ncbi:hypothetical protein C1I98_00675 [Spongiactinospora gelatinilytica]|uniref:Zinc finger CGNR domain-containing protein n=1 Tax=Spongiactinospora gelatinilytica TaxID=2666298 RepID=A0A2W2J520_9ACTN|nr:CGNR zinc finger domain-containing protein [Spongiactinospora gelatinilytica]PZG56724.1 hypothetical protein C1I98_00675 [Spongiactinospora gelatinilytica]